MSSKGGPVFTCSLPGGAACPLSVTPLCRVDPSGTLKTGLLVSSFQYQLVVHLLWQWLSFAC